ncbi:NADH dehydrogenase subunit 4 (mitochondrion) [Carettochelys insculpta]|uniref:NADH-ubiquinone oxidoreductase chain 4 n=1 Tax=Carettochelys insculpta TaxID=44489 RepID=D5FW31_CARIN|nr:NADH dehydrogenase subunit 4 [Carettochelys insculpta]ACO83368.1 NADH dehydrogenase subunit 4 [Carettochelys insculpta]
MLLPTIMLIPTTILCKPNQLWMTTTTHSLWIATMSLKWLKPSPWQTMTFSNLYMAVDQISAPLLILSCWLTPLMIMASQNHLITETTQRKRMFISTLIFLQTSLILAFSTTDLIMFFIAFETTLIPTTIIITRWGNQMERLNAGTYFLFYTLIGSIPLLIALMYLYMHSNTLYMPNMQLNPQTTSNTWTNTMWTSALLIAFMIKAPLYGLHLWLPKAHVEAPIAGSMILAAILLKLGGYGTIRILMSTNLPTNNLSYPFIILALWGMIMTGSICLRQTDLKSLIAYSSVSHMGLVIAAALTQTEWGNNGAIALMITHGFTSSMLFSLANMNYERIHSRIMLMAQNMQLLSPLLSLWWLLTCMNNMALPPTINLLSELTSMISLFNWSSTTIILTGLSTLITATYTLYMFTTTQWSQLPSHIKNISPTQTREHLISIFHIMPPMLLILKPELIWGIQF